MKVALDQAEMPLDCRMEAVVPAMHHQLQANRKAMHDIRADIENLRKEMKSYHDSRLEDRVKIVDDLARRLQRGVDFFRSGVMGEAIPRQEEVEAASPLMEVQPAESPEENSARQLQNDDDEGKQAITIRPQFFNLRDLYTYWHKHEIFGGKTLAELEETAKGIWKKRLKITSGEDTQLSKMSRIMKAVDEYAENKGMASEDVVESWFDDTKKTLV